MSNENKFPLKNAPTKTKQTRKKTINTENGSRCVIESRNRRAETAPSALVPGYTLLGISKADRLGRLSDALQCVPPLAELGSRGHAQVLPVQALRAR